MEWKSSQGTVTGKVKKKLVKPTEIKGHHVAASPENPKLLGREREDGGQSRAQNREH